MFGGLKDVVDCFMLPGQKRDSSGGDALQGAKKAGQGLPKNKIVTAETKKARR
jgi:hypothetical protein